MLESQKDRMSCVSNTDGSTLLSSNRLAYTIGFGPDNVCSVSLIAGLHVTAAGEIVWTARRRIAPVCPKVLVRLGS